jgi:ferric-dicitrate binding protein FerR (iron transport regulator)
MDKEKYIGYSVEDLLEDQEFITIVNNIRTNVEWEQFLLSNVSAKNNIIRAKRIVELFKTNEGKLAEDKKFKLWENISIFNKEFPRTIRHSKIRFFTRIAACLLIIVSIGSTIYFGFHQAKKSYEFTESLNELKTESPLLVLSDGTKVELLKDKSSVEVIKGQDAILVNEDSIVQNLPASQKESKQMSLNEITVPYGKNTTIILADGTKVWLNAGSHFAFPQRFNVQKREVFLEGEAYFEVTKNSKQPFIVSTQKIDVEVLGTKFNLSAYQSDNFCETVLLEGAVKVQDKGKLFKDKINLSPNQKATYYADKKEIIRTIVPNTEMYISWIKGWCQFSNENMVVVLAKLERYYNVKFVHDRAMGSKAFPISGKLDLKDSLNEVMLVLSKVAKINYQISGDKVIIKDWN